MQKYPLDTLQVLTVNFEQIYPEFKIVIVVISADE